MFALFIILNISIVIGINKGIATIGIINEYIYDFLKIRKGIYFLLSILNPLLLTNEEI